MIDGLLSSIFLPLFCCTFLKHRRTASYPRNTSPVTLDRWVTLPPGRKWPLVPSCSGPTRCSEQGCTTDIRISWTNSFLKNRCLFWWFLVWVWLVTFFWWLFGGVFVELQIHIHQRLDHGLICRLGWHQTAFLLWSTVRSLNLGELPLAKVWSFQMGISWNQGFILKISYLFSRTLWIVKTLRNSEMDVID